MFCDKNFSEGMNQREALEHTARPQAKPVDSKVVPHTTTKDA